MAQLHLIKLLHEREGLSQREIARQLGVSRNTVSHYLQTGELPNSAKRKEVYGKREFTGETLRVLPIIDAWLEEDTRTWKKQRHTAVRIFHRLVDEHGFKGSESNIRRVVRLRLKQLQEVFIALEFQLGQHFQFDWGEADAVIGRSDESICFAFSCQPAGSDSSVPTCMRSKNRFLMALSGRSATRKINYLITTWFFGSMTRKGKGLASLSARNCQRKVNCDDCC